MAPPSVAIIGAMLSPDEFVLPTVSGSERLGRQVPVRDVAGRHETIPLSEAPGAIPSDLTDRVSTWARNDTVLFLGGGLGRGILLVQDRTDDSGT